MQDELNCNRLLMKAGINCEKKDCPGCDPVSGRPNLFQNFPEQKNGNPSFCKQQEVVRENRFTEKCGTECVDPGGKRSVPGNENRKGCRTHQVIIIDIYPVISVKTKPTQKNRNPVCYKNCQRKQDWEVFLSGR